MANAYSTPERAAAHMQKLEDNGPVIDGLRKVLADEDTDMSDRVLAFTQMFELHAGDPLMQRRLVLNLEHAAWRHKRKEQ